MEIRHDAVLLGLRILARKWVQNRRSLLVWICNAYTACRRIVGTAGNRQSLSAHRPSRLVWMCNGYTACGWIVGPTWTRPTVSALRSSRLVWMCNGDMACCRIVGTMVTATRVILKDIFFNGNQKSNRQQFPKGCNAKRELAAAREKQ